MNTTGVITDRFYSDPNSPLSCWWWFGVPHGHTETTAAGPEGPKTRRNRLKLESCGQLSLFGNV
jgi:hypothetical protein